MEERIKKEVWKVVNVAVFLFVSILFILPYLVQTSTYFHERGHIRALGKYGIESEYSFSLLETIPNFWNPKTEKLGVTKFNFNKYQNLGAYQKTEVNLAGIVSDLRFLFLVGIYLTLSNVYLAYKMIFGKTAKVGWILGINWVLFMWLLVLIQITLANATYEAGDVYQLVRFLIT